MIKTETKRWGNSLGIVIPKKVVQDLNLKPHEEVVVEIKRSANVLDALFGAAQYKKDPAAILRETRKELESKYAR
jgi:antitoxin component of MazEF toxin-antitoxin module